MKKPILLLLFALLQFIIAVECWSQAPVTVTDLRVKRAIKFDSTVLKNGQASNKVLTTDTNGNVILVLSGGGTVYIDSIAANAANDSIIYWKNGVRYAIVNDGSKTKINQGANITITGNGTIASPYVINASGGSSQTLNQTLRYGNSGDTATFFKDSLQAQKIDVNKGGIGLGGYKYSTTLPIGAGGVFTKDSIVSFGASYETASPPTSLISYVDLVANIINSTVYRFAISGTGFQVGNPNSFMSRLSQIPTYRPTLRYLFFGGSNILNDYTLDRGYLGLDTAIVRAVDSMVYKGWAKDRLVLFTNPNTGNFSGNTSDTSRLYAEMAIKGAKLAGVRYVDIEKYLRENGGTSLFMGSDSIHGNAVCHYAISDGALKSAVSSLVTSDGIKILKGGINIQDNSAINFSSYNSTSANRILTWDNGATNNRSGIGKINTYGLGLFAPFSGDGIYAGLGQDATTLNSTTAHWYLTGITTARSMNFNSNLFFNANDWTISWTPDAAAKNKMLLSNWGATNQKIGIGTTADGNGGMSIFSQNFYFNGGDILLASGYDATNMTRGNAALIVKPSNRVTVRDIFSVGNKGLFGDTTTTNAHTTLQTNSFATGYTSTATGITLGINNNVVEITATGQTITLPTAAGIAGRIYTIKLTAIGTGTIATTSSQTIDGSTTYSLSAQNKYVTVQSNGSNWIVIGNN